MEVLETQSPPVVSTGFKKLTVKYVASINIGNYSSFGAETLVVLDLEPDMTQEQVSQKFSEVWEDLHNQFGLQAQKIIHRSSQVDFDKVNFFHQALRPFLTVFKTLWGALSVSKELTND